MKNLRSLFIVLALAGAARLSAQSGSALPRSTPEQQGISSASILAFVQAADTSVDAMNSFMPTAFNVAPAFLALALVGPVAKWLDLQRRANFS